MTYEGWIRRGTKAEKRVAALEAEVERLRSYFCEAHQPLKGEKVPKCPCCFIVHIDDENKRLRARLDYELMYFGAIRDIDYNITVSEAESHAHGICVALKEAADEG